jgi:uncharacterized protein YnzC (UPF0291/DUF896 family)
MMKTIKILSLLALIILVACGPKRERFNYTMIKSKMDLTEEQTKEFDKLTAQYLKKARKTIESNLGNKEATRKAIKTVFAEQDEKIKAVLNEEQFAIYAHEIHIEREGREKYNSIIIRDELGLDSLQQTKYNQANEAFYTTLYDAHDNYHGKPAVYRLYYKEIDKSRREAFQAFMSADQYSKFEQLAIEYELGQSEH